MRDDYRSTNNYSAQLTITSLHMHSMHMCWLAELDFYFLLRLVIQAANKFHSDIIMETYVSKYRLI